MPTLNRSSFRTILSILFLDNLGLMVVYPIFTPLVLKPIYSLMPHYYPISIRLMILGALIAAFPLAQFVGGPVISRLADLKGRKYAFTFTLIGEGIGFFLTGLSIQMMSLSFLIFSRLFTGFFAGNIMVCLSAIADQKSSRNFKVVSSVMGISFVIAIVIGGILSNGALDAFFNSSFPFLALGFFALIHIGMIRFKFRETKEKPAHKKHYMKELGQICTENHLKYLYGTFFCLMLGWIIALQFLSTFLIEHFSKGRMAITLSFIGVGLAWCAGSLGIHRLLARLINPARILLYALFFATFSVFITAETKNFALFIHCMVLGGFFTSMAWTSCLDLISINAPPRLKGKLLGINQSVAMISMAFAPLFGGLVGQLDIRTIYLFASGLLLISLTVLFLFNYKNHF